MSMTVIEPTLDDNDTNDGPDVTHIINKNDEMLGYFHGQEIEALCGERFIPTRDPQQFPVCKACLDVLKRIGNAGGN